MKKTPQIAVITSPNMRCGIREHSSMLMEAVRGYLIQPIFSSYGSPADFEDFPSLIYNIDHHAALHSEWTPEVCDTIRATGSKVVVTQHDTYETLDIMKERGLHDFHDHVDALIVHEPVEGLTDQGYPNVFYWRQPVPDLPLDVPPEPAGYVKPLNDPPIVGTVGFDFPWKGFEELKEVAGKAGWEARILGGPENWLPRGELIKELRACDATAFLYSTGNSGTSAAIRMGIAARRPLIAYRCRQFRDIREGIIRIADQSVVHDALRFVQDVGSRETETIAIQRLADRLSWTNAGRRYARLYRSLLS